MMLASDTGYWHEHGELLKCGDVKLKMDGWVKKDGDAFFGGCCLFRCCLTGVSVCVDGYVCL